MNTYALIPLLGQLENLLVVNQFGYNTVNELGDPVEFVQTHWVAYDPDLDSKTLPEGSVKFENSEQLLQYYGRLSN